MAQLKIARVVITAVTAAVLAGPADMVIGPAAAAPATPSDAELERARQVERAAAATAAQADERLAAATARFDELMLAAAQATEAHNGARHMWEQARVIESGAVDRAAREEAASDTARAHLGRVAATAYRTGGQLALVAAVIDAEGSDKFVDGTAVLRTVARSQGTIADLAAEAAVRAHDAAKRAHQARLDRENAAAVAEAAAELAADAVAEFESQMAGLERERESALAELAEARGTTIALEEQRQAALALAAAEAEAATAVTSRPDDPVQARTPTPDALAPDAADPADADPPSAATPEPVATGRPAPSPSPNSATGTAQQPTQGAQPSQPSPPGTSASSSPSPASGIERVIDYARAQLGKPYEWGAAGPNSFDCSGLTMRAWQQAGVSLPHWSVAQARMVTRVSYADLRPGDLIFWSDNGQASGTYHMGLYVGSGKMIHAPRTGKVVEVQNVFYWRTPSFYGRV